MRVRLGNCGRQIRTTGRRDSDWRDVFGDGKTSLRGGYGMGFERNFGNVTYNVLFNLPQHLVASIGSADVGGNLPIST